MAEPNLRDLVGDIRQALEHYPPEALIDMLTHIFKEYVVEEPAPIASNFPVMRDPLEGLGFAELVRALQLRLDVPELALFDIQGDRVYVKIGGQRLLLEASASRADPVPAPLASPTPPVPTPEPAASPPRRAESPGTGRGELPSPTAASRQAATPAVPAKPAPEASTTPAPGSGPKKDEPAAGGEGKKFNLLEVD